MKKPLVKDQTNSLSNSPRLGPATQQSRRLKAQTSHFEIRATRDFPVSRPEKNIPEDDAQYLLGYN